MDWPLYPFSVVRPQVSVLRLIQRTSGIAGTTQPRPAMM